MLSKFHPTFQGTLMPFFSKSLAIRRWAFWPRKNGVISEDITVSPAKMDASTKTFQCSWVCWKYIQEAICFSYGMLPEISTSNPVFTQQQWTNKVYADSHILFNTIYWKYIQILVWICLNMYILCMFNRSVAGQTTYIINEWLGF